MKMLSSEYSVTEARVSETHHLRYYILQDGSSENQVNEMNGSEGQMMGQQLQMVVPPVDFHLGLIRKKIAEIERIQLERIVIGVEYCYHVVIDANKYSVERFEACFGERLKWILCDDPFNSAVELLSKGNSNRRQRQITKKSAFESKNWRNIFEIGPRRTFTTAFSTNAVAVCQAAGIDGVRRLERSVRYEIEIIGGGDQGVLLSNREQILAILHDRMTECEYEHDAEMCFERFDVPERYFEVDLMSAAENLRAANEQLGLAFDEADLDYYYDLFVNKLKRNPTDVELFDLAQSNSEHSRHTFFKGELILDGVKRDKSLFDSLRDTQTYSNANNIIAFSDNSSAIEGFDVFNLLSLSPCSVSEIAAIQSKRHIIYSAETHNFPTGVCPFPGAATGTGGRIRDIHATGRGAHEIAGVVGYAFGNMHLDGYALPWEEKHFKYDRKFAHPRDIIIQASNGASDYGNKFGEPVICGFSRSFGQRIADERWEYVKPILFSGGIGSIDEAQIKKRRPELGTLVAKIGGPAYRIGLGGGAASSVKIQGDDERRDSELDFGAVQRGDPEMEQKLHRVIRACVEYAENNPILSIHDQGAGGNGNVLKEIVDDEECGGAVLHACNFPRGDQTLSIRELWGAEYQENDAILLDASNVNLIQRIAKREKCSVSVVGEVTGDRKVVLLDYDSSNIDSAPVNLDLGVLGQRAPKVFHLKTIPRTSVQLKVPSTLSTQDALALVLRLPSVASKRFLTNKVDRSVTGLIAQQQCVGPLQTPLADVGVVALSYWNNLGGAVAVGEQPVKGMLSAEAGARMSLAEALTNLVFAPITHRKDIKCSGNWMWAAKLDGEGMRLVRACDALCDAMRQLGVAIDGGKDSLSMAAKVNGEIVKAPGTLVISAYAPCTNVTEVVTPDLKGSEDGNASRLIYVRFGNDGSEHRLGASALAQCLKQIGNNTADIDDVHLFKRAFDVTQNLVKKRRLISGHDVSDGGLLVCVLEMAFAGNRSFVLQLTSSSDPLETLFAEESGIVVETNENQVEDIVQMYRSEGIHAQCIGFTTNDVGRTAMVVVNVNGETALSAPLCELREIWEETSAQLELLQTSEECVKQQKHWIRVAAPVHYSAHFDFSSSNVSSLEQKVFKQYSVAIIREEGSNGDREMSAAFHMAGFTPFDVTMSDLVDCEFGLERFSGIAFVGGFSFGDVLGSARGWASSILFHGKVFEQLRRFRQRQNTFSLGVCNGCQLMAHLGWIGNLNNEDSKQNVLLKANDCGRFQSSFTTVRINRSPSIMLSGMHGSVLGVWSAHGEGKFTYRNDEVLEQMISNELICVQYCDGNGKPSMIFPENPNGSIESVAAICSLDGRHLAMMPHPDRSFISWQWPNYPKQFKLSNQQNNSNNNNSPWMRMFINAYEWVKQQQ